MEPVQTNSQQPTTAFNPQRKTYKNYRKENSRAKAQSRQETNQQPTTLGP
jgi:hypothetical protein